MNEQDQTAEIMADGVVAGGIAPENPTAVFDEAGNEIPQPKEQTHREFVEEVAKTLEENGKLDGSIPDSDEEDYGDAYCPDATEQMLITIVKSGGDEFKALHVKLTELFTKIRPRVQEIKDNLFQVRQGFAGREVVVNDEPMNWEEFCDWAFGVTTKRINQLLEIDNLKATNVQPSHRKTAAEVKAELKAEVAEEVEEQVKEAREEGYAEGLANRDTSDEVEPVEVAAEVKAAIEETELPKSSSVNAFSYFSQFVTEPQTLASELATMLVEMKLDQQTIKQVLELTEKDAVKMLISPAL